MNSVKSEERKTLHARILSTWYRKYVVDHYLNSVTGAAFINGWVHLPGGGTSYGGSSGSTIHQVFRAEMVCR